MSIMAFVKDPNFINYPTVPKVLFNSASAYISYANLVCLLFPMGDEVKICGLKRLKPKNRTGAATRILRLQLKSCPSGYESKF